MSEDIYNKLKNRNDRIIEIIENKIKTDCPNAVDLIGIAGSFCSGDIHEKSDLDLLIITNDDSAKVLDICFILEDIGIDIYTCTWDRIEALSEYDHPYVTKLFDLDIIYVREPNVLEHYKQLQNRLLINMKDNSSINAKVGRYFSKILSDYESILNSNDKGIIYRTYAHIIQNIEYIIYMLNHTYVKYGVRRIPNEISKMPILPPKFLDNYLKITDFENTEDIKNKTKVLIEIMEEFLKSKNITWSNTFNRRENNITKREIQSTDLTGTYEEIHSNWYNKMLLAANTEDQYLSFMTMASCQELYDEMYELFLIPQIELISEYNKSDLSGNTQKFTLAMNEWKKLYDNFDKKIFQIDTLDQLEKYYNQNKKAKL